MSIIMTIFTNICNIEIKKQIKNLHGNYVRANYIIFCSRCNKTYTCFTLELFIYLLQCLFGIANALFINEYNEAWFGSRLKGNQAYRFLHNWEYSSKILSHIALFFKILPIGKLKFGSQFLLVQWTDQIVLCRR